MSSACSTTITHSICVFFLDLCAEDSRTDLLLLWRTECEPNALRSIGFDQTQSDGVIVGVSFWCRRLPRKSQIIVPRMDGRRKTRKRESVSRLIRHLRQMSSNSYIAYRWSTSVPLDLRSVVYCTAIRHGGDKEWHFLWDRYSNSNVGSEKSLILSALGCSREIWLLQRYLDWTLNESSGVRKQDRSTVFDGVAQNEVGLPLAKSFLFEKIDEIYKT